MSQLRIYGFDDNADPLAVLKVVGLTCGVALGILLAMLSSKAMDWGDKEGWKSYKKPYREDTSSERDASFYTSETYDYTDESGPDTTDRMRGILH